MADFCHSQKRPHYELFGRTINSAIDVALRSSRVHVRILEQYARALNVNVEVTKTIQIFVKINLYITQIYKKIGNLAWLNVNVDVAHVVTALVGTT